MSIITTYTAKAEFLYQTSCSINDGTLEVKLDTNSEPLYLKGEIKIETFDRLGNNVGTTNSYQKMYVSEYSTKTIYTDRVDWYVKSCEVNMEKVDWESLDNRPSETVVIHRKPTVIVHEDDYPRYPRINVHLPLPLPMIHTRSDVRVHTHVPHHRHRRDVIIRERHPERRIERISTRTNTRHRLVIH